MAEGFRFLEIALLLIGGYALLPANGLVCFHCDNVPSPSHCNTTTTCPTGENCFTEELINTTGNHITFKLGCRSALECSKISQQPASSFVGKRNSPTSDTCIQCCGVDMCNAHICALSSAATTKACTDDDTINCAAVSERFPICSDVQNAMKSCKRFCGLCPTDGHWSDWVTWSVCGSSCGQSQRSRSRTCTNPAPANGGSDCQGNTMETETCSTGHHCPVHGQWTYWSPWGMCSVTCGIGLERRDRSCSNPYPAYGGDYCPGDTRDDRPCVEKACADGGWSTWSLWGTCSGGLKSRSRRCDNPRPSQFGRDCVGTDVDKERCGPIAFTVAYGNSGLYSGGIVIFKTVVTNHGNGYSAATGKFTCSIPGLYSFSFSLSVVGNNDVHCWIRKNANSITYAQTGGASTFRTVSASVYLDLTVGDEVYIGNCGGPSHIGSDRATTFSGALF